MKRLKRRQKCLLTTMSEHAIEISLINNNDGLHVAFKYIMFMLVLQYIVKSKINILPTCRIYDHILMRVL